MQFNKRKNAILMSINRLKYLRQENYKKNSMISATMRTCTYDIQNLQRMMQ